MSTVLQCFIIDDEPSARELIKKYVSRIPFLEVAGEFGNAVDALFQMELLKPHLIFLDVEMPEMTGFEFIRTLKGHLRPKILMFSAYPHYALEGFEHEVTDYLLKPVSFERFIRAVNKVTEQLDLKTEKTEIQPFSEPEPPVVKQPAKTKPSIKTDFLLIKEDKKLIRVVPDQIILIEAMKDYIKIYLPGKTIVTLSTMTKMESMLPENRFIRVNRSNIIRINAIQEIDGNQITTVDGKKVDIGITYRETVLEALKKAAEL
jgi:two-component system LytT family response regulator